MLEVNDHTIYQAATTGLEAEQRMLLMEIMRIADEAVAAATMQLLDRLGDSATKDGDD